VGGNEGGERGGVREREGGSTGGREEGEKNNEGGRGIRDLARSPLSPPHMHTNTHTPTHASRDESLSRQV
jgi:hypothetical protein